MDTIRFEPSIGVEFAVDRRRKGSADDMFADMLGDQLKKRAESERAEPIVRRRPPAERRHSADAQPEHGRPIRPVIRHPHTLRGEAAPVEEERPLIGGRQDTCAPAACMDAEADSTLDPIDQGNDPELAQDSDQDTETATPEAAESEQADIAATAAPVTVALAVAPTETSETPLLAEAVVAGDMANDAAAPDSIVPAEEELPQQPGTETAETADTTLQSAAGFTAALAASQAETAAAALGDTIDETAAPPQTLGVPNMASLATSPAPAAEDNVAVPSGETAEAAAQTVTLTPEAPRAAEPAKPRQPRIVPQAEIRAQTPAAMPATPAQAPIPPAPQWQSAGIGEFASTPFETATFEGDGTAMPGWALHLAQGSAAKRPDFIAQLRQHLQDLPAHEQVAVNIQRALREGTGRISIQLSPAELGKIHVKLDIDEEKRVTAAVTVEKPSTLELLQRDARALERALHEAGLKMDGSDLSFSLGRQDGKDFSQDLGDSGRSAFGAAEAENQVDAEIEAGPATQVDTAAGLVNLEV